MNVGRIVKMAVAAGIVYNVLDYVSLTYLLSGTIATMAPIMNPAPSMAFNLINNFIAGLMLAVVFERVRSSFGAGLGGGVQFGLYAGLLVNLPLWLGLRVFIRDIPYGTAWIMTIYGVVAYILMGAAAGFAGEIGEPKPA